MDRKEIKVKSTAEVTKDDKIVTLYPLKGVVVSTELGHQEFNLGEDIDKYKSLKYDFDPKLISSSGQALDFDSYILSDFPLSLWVDDESGKDIVHIIECEKTCLWQNKELIGMNYNDFINYFNVTPDSIDSQWTSGPIKNDRNYHIYRFDSLGIELWVWRNRIRQILISMPDIDND